MFTYPRKKRLRSKKLIAELFEKGKSFGKYPLRMIYLEVDALPEDVLVQSAVSVSKKRFKRAVKRNLLKRRMREAIRLNFHQLETVLDKKGKKMALMIVYISNDVLPYKEIENALNELILSLNKKLSA